MQIVAIEDLLEEQARGVPLPVVVLDVQDSVLEQDPPAAQAAEAGDGEVLPGHQDVSADLALPQPVAGEAAAARYADNPALLDSPPEQGIVVLPERPQEPILRQILVVFHVHDRPPATGTSATWTTTERADTGIAGVLDEAPGIAHDANSGATGYRRAKPESELKLG